TKKCTAHVDGTAPTLTVDCTALAACHADNAAAIADVLAHSSASDNYDASITPTAAVTGGTACNPEITVTATDSCGNTTTKKCTAHVDGAAPTLTVDCTALAACHADNAAAVADVLAHSSATDTCDATVTPTAAVTGGTACNPEITVTATDSCGNTTTKKCTAHVDGAAPTLTVDCTALAACHADNAAAVADVLAHSSATDNCDATVTPTAAVTGGTACNPEITVTATDSCGNSTSKKCTAHVDGAAPTLRVDCTALAACHADNAAAVADVLAHSSATDNCDATV